MRLVILTLNFYKPGNSHIADFISHFIIFQDDIVESFTDDSYICTVASLAVPCVLWVGQRFKRQPSFVEAIQKLFSKVTGRESLLL